MRNLVILLTLFFTSVIFGQIDDRSVAFVINGSVSVSSPTYEIPLNWDYEWLTLTVQDTGTTYDDSLIVEYGTPLIALDVTRPYTTYKDTGTIWQRPQFMRDSSWTNTNLVVDDNSVHSYQIYVGSYSVIRIRMTNVQVVANRKAFFKGTASRKK